ncbi:MAG: lysophospholipid acyltransferase family protein [Planctomycetota bacterium]
MLKLLAKGFLRWNGWEPEGELPPERSFVLVSAPHTSNWDFVYLLALASVYGIRLRWIGKHTLFMWPFGGLMRFLGGVSIDRRSRQNMVEQVCEAFRTRPDLIIAVPPEATRSRAEHWKTGFYYMALGAKVPIVLGFLDYKRRRGGFGPSFHPSGDIDADMKKIRDFYQNITGKHPEHFGPIRIKPPVEARS